MFVCVSVFRQRADVTAEDEKGTKTCKGCQLSVLRAAVCCNRRKLLHSVQCSSVRGSSADAAAPININSTLNGMFTAANTEEQGVGRILVVYSYSSHTHRLLFPI